MKAKEVLDILRITRASLTKYVKNGNIIITVMGNGRYDYDRESVMKFRNKGIDRKTVCYARVSTAKQKQDLENQINLLKQWCFNNNYSLSAVYKDVSSGISFSERKELMKLVDDICASRIKKVVITYKDRLSRIAFDFFKLLFEKYGTEIEVISEVGNSKLDSEEVFEEIVTLLHCYSMKLYSSRRKKAISDLCLPESQ